MYFVYEMSGNSKPFIVDLMLLDVDGLGLGMDNDRRFDDLFLFFKNDICKHFKLEDIMSYIKVRVLFGEFYESLLCSVICFLYKLHTINLLSHRINEIFDARMIFSVF